MIIIIITSIITIIIIICRQRVCDKVATLGLIIELLFKWCWTLGSLARRYIVAPNYSRFVHIVFPVYQQTFCNFGAASLIIRSVCGHAVVARLSSGEALVLVQILGTAVLPSDSPGSPSAHCISRSPLCTQCSFLFCKCTHSFIQNVWLLECSTTPYGSSVILYII